MGMIGLTISGPVFGHHAEQATGIHNEVAGMVSKISSGIVFVETSTSTRTIPLKKAERMGLYDPRMGDKVFLYVNENNVIMDVHKAGDPIHGHNLISGNLEYMDPMWEEVQISTPEGTKRFDVDALTSSKLSVFEEGSPVTLELDESNVMIDIRRGH